MSRPFGGARKAPGVGDLVGADAGIEPALARPVEALAQVSARLLRGGFSVLGARPLLDSLTLGMKQNYVRPPA